MKNILLSLVFASAACVSLSINATTESKTVEDKAINETEMVLKQLEIAANDACAKTRQACLDCNNCEDVTTKCVKTSTEDETAK